MNIEDFIKEHLGEYRIKGKEAVIRICPFCGRDKNKFYMNIETGLYNCFSGSCGEKGTIETLMKHLGINQKVKKKPVEKSEIRNTEKIELNRENYSSIGVLKENKIISKKQAEFLENRGISWETAAEMDVWVRRSDGWLTFIYRNKKRVLAVKYRDINKKDFRLTKSEDINPLFNIHRVTGESVIICEGEMDVLACAEVGMKDKAVSVPNGTNNLGWIEYNWDFLESKKEIILAFDNDTAGEKAIKEVLKRLDITKCRYLDMKGEKDLNDILINLGKVELLNILNNPLEFEIEGLQDITNEKMDTGSTEAIFFEMESLDKQFGGCRFGELTIVSGQPGAGKSTILNQIICDFVNQDEKVFYYSGEFPKAKAKRWLYTVFAGADSLTEEYDKHKRRNKYVLKPGIERQIDNWAKNKIFIYDKGTEAKQNELFTIMKYGYKKHGIRLFFLDNLMTIGLDEVNDDKYENQKNFLTELHDFAIEYNVHVFLVAHPKKTENKKIQDLSFYDIAGSSNIPNLADNILFMKRLNEKEKEEMYNKMGHNYTTAAILLKDREYGEMGTTSFFGFQYTARRFFNPETKIEIRKKYRWVENLRKLNDEDLEEIEKLLGV
ncbi:Replicative DNA helicase [Sebaldella termitidis]|uniref:TOPRIM domain protein n=2 Tax=Sebaldella TaxID=32068 RepID=D1AGM4_SEBTE|nr:toprim domain-containing protein [Sebaldella termitidis]ACZ10744.1 TOPRIM domain protein [Sebaldella termitidis ATCC 33386]SUI26087.1 Replicative DNA helicase [Sebaldella termitidis]